MSSTEPTATTPTAGETSGTPPPTASSEINAVPAGDAVKEKTQSKVPGAGTDSVSPGKKSSAKASRRTPSMARTELNKKGGVEKDATESGEEGEGKEGGSDAESEYETICVRRKKPTPLFQRLRRFLSNYLAFDLYMSSVMWEAFKLVVITSQFNWALEILAGVMHILVAAGRCALKKQCTAEGRRKSDTSETDQEKTPEPETKKASVKSMATKPSTKPSTGGPTGSIAKSPSKGGAGSEPPTTTTESGEPKTSETEPTSTEGTGPTTSETAGSPTSSG